MKNLINAKKKELLKSKKETLVSINEIKEIKELSNKWFLSDLLPSSKKVKDFKTVAELKTYLKLRLEKRHEKRISEAITKIESYSNTVAPTEIKITVTWKDSRTWGANPTAEAWYPYNVVKSGSIGGCGYDKESTAIAEALNQIDGLIGLMYYLKNKNIKKENKELFGYGSGYRNTPQFEGGVGVSCYYDIFKTLGYKFEKIASGKSFDVYRATQVKKIKK